MDRGEASGGDGAVATFLGLVRNHNLGRQVRHLEYEAYAPLARAIIGGMTVSLVLTVLIFVYGYHETGRPFKATLCLIVGLGYTMGYTTLVVGHLNILTITFAPILIGLDRKSVV